MKNGVLALAAFLLLAGGWAASARLGRRYVLASFTTDLSERSPAQRHNILTAMARIDGTVLVPGAAFSFNRTVGPRCFQDGYDAAPAMQHGGIVDTAGGGICQLSSTLYNAALLAGLSILERSPHAETIYSVGPGRDATVLYGKWDLRFADPYRFTVELRLHAAGDRLVASVLGTHPRPCPVEVSVERLGGPGVCVQTWRRIGSRSELISEDRYLR